MATREPQAAVCPRCGEGLLPGDDEDLWCPACSCRVPLAGLETRDLFASVVKLLEASVRAVGTQVQGAEDRSSRLLGELRRLENALAVLRGEPVRRGRRPHRWTDGQRAAAARRMREFNAKRKREGAAAEATA